MSRNVSPTLQTPVTQALVLIGANISLARKEGFRMSQEKFAEVLGITRVTLHRMERGDPGVAAIYYFAAMEVIRCLSRVVEATDPSTLIMSLAPVSWPSPGEAAFPANSDSQLEKQEPDSPAPVRGKSKAWPIVSDSAKESPAGRPAVTGFGPTLVLPLKKPKP